MNALKTLCIALLSLGCATAANAAGGTSSIVIDAQSGNVLYADKAEELRYPASLTKLMTLYITFNALETGKLKFSDKLKVSSTAASRSPSKLGMPAGSYIDVKTAVEALIVKSANDCATVLAEALSPSEAEFAKLMTKTARKLGMYRTTFKKRLRSAEFRSKNNRQRSCHPRRRRIPPLPAVLSPLFLKRISIQRHDIQNPQLSLKRFAGNGRNENGLHRRFRI